MRVGGGHGEGDPRVGRVLDGKWTLERLLGTGGMASVYAARHRNGARAAVKVLHPDLAVHKEIRERFLREGYAANRVEHPGAVSVLDDDVVKEGPDAGAAYIVMELLDGELLEDRAARPFSEEQLLAIADSVLDVLDAAHKRGVIHRDIKPDNLFVLRTDDGSTRVKVLDFGLARLTEGRVSTRAGVALGTPSFMSPEQAAGRTDEIDGRSDLFSVGAVLFRLRTGKRIHDAPTALELVGRMANEPAPPIRTIEPSVSPELAAIVDRALAFAREDRYPDAATMRADVRKLLVSHAPATTSVEDTVREPRRGFGWAFLLLVALGGGFVWYQLRLAPKLAVPAPSSSVALDTNAPDTSIVDQGVDADAFVEDTLAFVPMVDAEEDADDEEDEAVDAFVDADAEAPIDATLDAPDAADATEETDADAPVVDAAHHDTAPAAKPKPPPKKAPPPPPTKKKKKKKKK